jgi:23S rRNA pseudouridine2457 synthase
MTARVGLPTLRLVRWRIGEWSVEGLAPGEWKIIEVEGGGPRPAVRGAPSSTKWPRRAGSPAPAKRK